MSETKNQAQSQTQNQSQVEQSQQTNLPKLREFLETIGVDSLQIGRFISGEQTDGDFEMATKSVLKKVGEALLEDKSFVEPIERNAIRQAEGTLTKRFASAIGLSTEQQSKSEGDPEMVIKYFQQNQETGDKEVDGMQRTINDLNQQIHLLTNETIPQLETKHQRELKLKDTNYAIRNTLQGLNIQDGKYDEAKDLIEFRSNRMGYTFDLGEDGQLRVTDKDGRVLRDSKGIRQREPQEVFAEMLQNTGLVASETKVEVPEPIDQVQEPDSIGSINLGRSGNAVNVNQSMRPNSSKNSYGPSPDQLARNDSFAKELAKVAEKAR